MILHYLRSLHSHGEWADARLLAAVQSAPDASALGDVMKELGHVRGAQELWLSRIEGRSPTVPVWPVWSAAELAEAGTEIDRRMRLLLEFLTSDSVSRTYHYRNRNGDPFDTPLGDMLLHVLMHGQYHRGRANVALKAAGIEPVGLDYILWQWQA